MGLIGTVLAKVGLGGVTKAVETGGKVLDNLFTSDEERAEAARLMAQIEMKPMEGQWQVNLAEAQHRSIWVAGWRPAIGWVCAASLGSYYIPQYLIGSIIWAIQCWEAKALQPYPLSIEGLLGLVASLLGMGTLRTIEKFGKVTK